MSKVKQIIPKKEAEQYSIFRKYNFNGKYIKSLVFKMDIYNKSTKLDEFVNEETTLKKWLRNNNIYIDSKENTKKDILLLALVYDIDFKLSYGMTAPYTHSYYVVSRGSKYITPEYCEPVTANDWYEDLVENLYMYLCKHSIDVDYKAILEKLKLAIRDYNTLEPVYRSDAYMSLTSLTELNKEKQYLKGNVKAGEQLERSKQQYLKRKQRVDKIVEKLLANKLSI